MPPASVYKAALQRKKSNTLREQIRRVCATPVKQDQRFKVGDQVVIHAKSRYYPHQMEEAAWQFGEVVSAHQTDTHNEYYCVEWPNGYSNFYEPNKLTTGVLFETNESAAVLLKGDDDGL